MQQESFHLRLCVQQWQRGRWGWLPSEVAWTLVGHGKLKQARVVVFAVAAEQSWRYDEPVDALTAALMYLDAVDEVVSHHHQLDRDNTMLMPDVPRPAPSMVAGRRSQTHTLGLTASNHHGILRYSDPHRFERLHHTVSSMHKTC